MVLRLLESVHNGQSLQKPGAAYGPSFLARDSSGARWGHRARRIREHSGKNSTVLPLATRLYII